MQGELLISSQSSRSQLDNHKDALQRLQGILNQAAESIKPIESVPAKAKQLKKQKDKVRGHVLTHCAVMHGRRCEVH